MKQRDDVERCQAANDQGRLRRQNEVEICFFLLFFVAAYGRWNPFSRLELVRTKNVGVSA